MWIVAWMASAGAAAPEVEWTAMAGLQSAFGIPLMGISSPRERSPSLSLPVEVNLGIDAGPGFLVRAHVGAGALLNGTYLYTAENGRSVGFPHHIDLALSAGLRINGISVGALGGFQLPSRTTVRGFVGWNPEGSPLIVELRAGANLPTERRTEPVLQLWVGLNGPLSRNRE
ncbi:MAG: hypothetical protein AAGA48_36630 [Myxococcota bacterium]